MKTALFYDDADALILMQSADADTLMLMGWRADTNVLMLMHCLNIQVDVDALLKHPSQTGPSVFLNTAAAQKQLRKTPWVPQNEEVLYIWYNHQRTFLG